MGALKFKVSREAPKGAETYRVIGATIGLYLLDRCYIYKKKSNGEDMVFCLPCMPSLLGVVYF